MTNAHMKRIKREIKENLTEASRQASFIAPYDTTDAADVIEGAEADWTSAMKHVLRDDDLTAQEKLYLATQEYYLFNPTDRSLGALFGHEQSYLAVVRSSGNDLIDAYLDAMIEAGTYAPSVALHTLSNTKFLARILQSDALTLKLMDALIRLPVKSSVNILMREFDFVGHPRSSVLEKLSAFRASNQEQFNQKAAALQKALLLKSNRPSERYKIQMMRIRETPSAPPMPDDMLPQAQPVTLDVNVPLAAAVLDVIQVQADLFHYERAVMPDYISDYIHDTVDGYRHLKLSSFWDIADNVTLLFSWCFFRQENLNKGMFLDALVAHINLYPDKSYMDCIDDVFETMPDSREAWRHEGPISRILQELQALDVPIVRVQNEVSDVEAKACAMPEFNQESSVIYEARPSFI